MDMNERFLQAITHHLTWFKVQWVHLDALAAEARKAGTLVEDALLFDFVDLVPDAASREPVFVDQWGSNRFVSADSVKFDELNLRGRTPWPGQVPERSEIVDADGRVVARIVGLNDRTIRQIAIRIESERELWFEADLDNYDGWHSEWVEGGEDQDGYSTHAIIPDLCTCCVCHPEVEPTFRTIARP